MGNAEYLFMAWALYSCIRLLIDWFGLNRNLKILIFPVLQLVAIGVIYITQHFTLGLLLSAFSNIIYYWLVRPKVIALNEKTTS